MGDDCRRQGNSRSCRNSGHFHVGAGRKSYLVCRILVFVWETMPLTDGCARHTLQS